MAWICFDGSQVWRPVSTLTDIETKNINILTEIRRFGEKEL
ncbi:hypothetical protein FDG2_2169 [Candidatus Protofrankia californiensis]|uniref:Uncharacterized protein n=1 Tax=Candidatus Protofrankia californiensis TaxID=1839754 RepID=A0A1C3NX13_9ACTN|nr:hypothetical protein FDG2_2169 [Candidatus Protofrankia californiensis]